jgi:hypothetical protein
MVGNCKSSNDGSAPSRSRASPGSWSGASLGSGRNRRFSKDYEYAVQTSEAMIDIATIRIMLNRLGPA